jgi:hypothetical protein
MRLLSLTIEPRGVNGWGSPTLAFGHKVTSLFAPNGSGKTPLIQSVAFCLGYPVTFRDDINNKCDAATLVVALKSEILKIRRGIGKDFHVQVTSEDGGTKEFFTERDFSTALFETLEMPLPKLVSTKKELAYPYLSTLLPLMYLDQDRGYADLYRAPGSFISDQAVEMVRFAFGLGPKHSFTEKSDLLKAKEDLEGLDRRIVNQQKAVTDLSKGVDDRPETQLAIERRAEEFRRKLADLTESANVKGSANSALEDLAVAKENAVRQTKQQVLELQERIDGLASIRSEIATEIDTLALNEESRRVFESFEDICRNPNCGLFIGSAESYAKNLLYLKDQIKDLERNADRASVRLEDLQGVLAQQQADLNFVTTRLKQEATASGVDDLVTAIQQMTQEVYSIERAKVSFDILKNERAALLKLQNDRERLHDRIGNLSVGGRSDHEFNRLRARLHALVVKWLDVLATQNVSRNVEIDLDFKFKFGGESFEAIKGSTKTRVVLAVHAAIFELYLEDPSREFRFVILDTPKQHEIHTSDLARYLASLAALCETADAQVIISSTEFQYPVMDGDAEWTPTFDGASQRMYLGPVANG